MLWSPTTCITLIIYVRHVLMMSVLIPTLNNEATLAATLESLIPAAVEGLVREVIVVDGGSTDATVTIADGFGATVLTAGPARSNRLIAGAQQAKGSWLLFLEPECNLQDGWTREAEKFAAQVDVDQHSASAATFRYALDDRTWAARTAELAVWLSSGVFGIVHSQQGLLISRALYAEIGGFNPLDRLEYADLGHRLGSKRRTRLRTVALSRGTSLRSAGPNQGLWRYYGYVGLFLLQIPIKRSLPLETSLATEPPSP
jgi:hypothetical protein